MTQAAISAAVADLSWILSSHQIRAQFTICRHFPRLSPVHLQPPDPTKQHLAQWHSLCDVTKAKGELDFVGRPKALTTKVEPILPLV